MAISLLGAITPLTHLAQVLGLEFAIYARTGLAAMVVVAAVMFYVLRRRLAAVHTHDVQVTAAVLMMGTVGAVISSTALLVSHDDFYYIPNAVHYLANPGESLGFGVHHVYVGERLLQSHNFSTALPFEYGQAIVARYLGTDYLLVYHGLTPAFVGFLIPLALFLLISRFSAHTAHVAISTACAIGVVLLTSEDSRSHGSFGFIRAFQGKTLLLALGVPLFAALSMDFFRTRSRVAWGWLFVTAVAMTGATASTIVVLCAFAVVLAISIPLAEGRLAGSSGVIAAYAMSLTYIIGYAASLLLASTAI